MLGRVLLRARKRLVELGDELDTSTLSCSTTIASETASASASVEREQQSPRCRARARPGRAGRRRTRRRRRSRRRSRTTSLGPAGRSIPTRLETSSFAAVTQRFPGPTILSTGAIVSVPYASAATAWAPPTA